MVAIVGWAAECHCRAKNKELELWELVMWVGDGKE